MSINTLDFLNKNQFRKYPFKADSTLTADNGYSIKSGLVVALGITTALGVAYTIDRPNIFLSQIFVKSGYVTFTISSLQSSGSILCLGSFSGTPTSNFYNLPFTPYQKYVSGNLMVGDISILSEMDGTYSFSPDSSKLEESTIFYYIVPRVTSLTTRVSKLTGNIKFGTLTNVIKNISGNTIQLGTTSNLNIASLADKSAEFNNCDTPVIRYVDGAVPFYDNSNNWPQLQGNLWLIGVRPIVFNGETGTELINSSPTNVYAARGSITTQTLYISDNTPITLNSLCTSRNSVLPPTDPVYINNLPNQISTSPTFSGKENYYTKSLSVPSNFFTVTEPEFLSWPQFFTSFSRFILSPTVNTSYNVPSTNVGSTIGSVKKVVFKNSGPSTYTVSIKHNNLATSSGYNLVSVNPYQSVTVLGSSDIPFAGNDTFQVYFNSVTSGGSTPVSSLQVILFYR